MSHWLLLLVFHSLREHDLFLSPIVGSNCDLSGDFLCSYLSSQDLQQSSSRSSSSSDDDYEPLDCSNSFYCPLCASRWKYLSCIFHCFDCSNPLSVQQVPPKPKEGKFSDPQRRRAPMNLEEPLKTLTEATDTDLRYCPFHKYRENVQFYGYFTLFATSLWFFLWPLAHPVEIFTLYFVYDIVWAYLPFLFLLCLFRQRVEYDKNFPTTQQLGDHFSPELMERNIETVLEYLPFDADDEIISIGRPRFEKESTRYYSPWLGTPFILFGTIYCVPIWVFVSLKLWNFGWPYVFTGYSLIFYLQLFLPLLAKSCGTTSFTILVACSKSLKFIAFGSSGVAVWSVEEPAAELSGQIFLVDHTTSSGKISLLPCKKVPRGSRGYFQLGEDQCFEFERFNSKIVSYQFSDPEVVGKFQKLPWFHLNAVSEENLPEPYAYSPTLSTPLIMWGFGILSTVVIFCLATPWIPVWWYFLVHVGMGYLSALSVWSRERDSDEPLPVWSHYVLFQSPETSSHDLLENHNEELDDIIKER